MKAREICNVRSGRTLNGQMFKFLQKILPLFSSVRVESHWNSNPAEIDVSWACQSSYLWRLLNLYSLLIDVRNVLVSRYVFLIASFSTGFLRLANNLSTWNKSYTLLHNVFQYLMLCPNHLIRPFGEIQLLVSIFLDSSAAMMAVRQLAQMQWPLFISCCDFAACLDDGLQCLR